MRRTEAPDNANAAIPHAGPLAGVRIIAVEQFGAGPYGTLLLADLGAEVIKIEDPASGGDIARYVPPGQLGTDSLYFEAVNRGKKSLCLDLTNAAGRSVFERLVATADAVYNNLRGDIPDRLGLTYEHLASINEAVVCVSLSAYGREGERRGHPGYDALIQAETGWAALTGDPDGPPVKSGLSVVDYSAGAVSALALMTGLFRAERTGKGGDLDTSLYETALSFLTYSATWFLTAGIPAERTAQSAHASMVPFQFFRTSDGYVAIACAKEKFFRALMAGLGLTVEDRFATFEARRDHRAELVALLQASLEQGTTEHWIGQFDGIVPIAPVRSLELALEDAARLAGGMFGSYEHPLLGTVRAVGTPIRVAGFQPSFEAAPPLDGDRLEILSSVGYSPAEIASLAGAGAFGPTSSP
jgi:crotonobetainyl-CoA:carnitine CoA-transferase CaiB-like acyl-CoA transferase